MELETLTQTIINALEDVKARDIKVFNTEELTDQFECVVIASGTSGRQTRALAYAVSHAVKAASDVYKRQFLKAQTECAPHLMPHRAHKPEQSAE